MIRTNLIILFSLLLNSFLNQISMTHLNSNSDLNVNSSTRSSLIQLIKSNRIEIEFTNLDNESLELNLDENEIKFDQIELEEIKINVTKKKIPKDKLSPIILIPGLEGTRLTATLDKPTSGHYYCKKKANKSFTIWINVEEFVIPAVNCFVENMKLHYDNETRRSSNTDGVNVEVPNWGSTEPIESLIGNRFVPQYYYFKDLVDELVEIGYERDSTIRGAGFDFR